MAKACDRLCHRIHDGFWSALSAFDHDHGLASNRRAVRSKSPHDRRTNALCPNNDWVVFSCLRTPRALMPSIIAARACRSTWTNGCARSHPKRSFVIKLPCFLRPARASSALSMLSQTRIRTSMCEIFNFVLVYECFEISGAALAEMRRRLWSICH